MKIDQAHQHKEFNRAIYNVRDNSMDPIINLWILKVYFATSNPYKIISKETRKASLIMRIGCKVLHAKHARKELGPRLVLASSTEANCMPNMAVK